MLSSLQALHRRFSARHHTILLAAIIAAFAVRPLIGDAGNGPILFSLALFLLLLVALYSIQVDELVGERAKLLRQRRWRQVVGGLLALVALAERLAVWLSPSPKLLAAGAIGWLGFFAFVTWNELRSLIRQKDVTGEAIAMSISVYLLLGLTWGLAYIVIFQHDPSSFAIAAPAGSNAASLQNRQALFPVFIYFSLTTLATIGYGDIVPVSLQARYLAVAEGITGQFYLAILVARLVALQMSRPRGSDSSQGGR